MLSEHHDRVRRVRDKFRTLDINEIASCFTDDVLVKYNQLEPISGKTALLAFLTPRYRILSEYQLDKNIVLTQGNEVCVEVYASYLNLENGKAYKSKIFEILHFQGELISRWEYVGHSEEIAR